jgi:hypothetical protein
VRSDDKNCEYIQHSALCETEVLCCAKEASYTAAFIKIAVYCAMTPSKLVNSY